MGKARVTVRLHVRWWLRCYLIALATACMLTDREPRDLPSWMIRHGIAMRVVNPGVLAA